MHPILGISLAKQPSDTPRSQTEMWALRSAATKPRQGNRGRTGKDAVQTSNSGRNIRFSKAQTNRLHQAEKAPSKASGPWRQSNTIVQPAESEMVSVMNRTNSKHKKSRNDSNAQKVPSISTQSHQMRGTSQEISRSSNQGTPRENSDGKDRNLGARRHTKTKTTS